MTDDVEMNKVNISVTIGELRVIVSALDSLEMSLNAHRNRLLCEHISSHERMAVGLNLLERWTPDYHAERLGDGAKHLTMNEISNLSASIFYLAERLSDTLDYHVQRLGDE